MDSTLAGFGKDSLTPKIDTINADYAESDVKEKINYKAEDSIVYDLENKKMYLYNGAEMKYQKIELNADAVEFDWPTFTMTAQGAKDSNGVMQGQPIFKDDGKDYRSGKLQYNFKTKRGKVYDVMTKEGEAYLQSEAVKRNENDEWFGYKTKFTTCQLDHPHFYFKAKKVKLIPKKVVVTGPANLWIGDVPTPIYLPFGIFPVNQGKRSGIIPPQWGFDVQRGFNLRGFGYYFAINDHADLKLTSDVYTNGTFGFTAATKLKWLYKFDANVAATYVRTAPIDPDLPKAKASNDFSINLNFSLDPRVAPTNTFNGTLNVRTSNFNKANNYYNQIITETQYNSNLNYSKSFTRLPWLSLSLSASHYQNVSTRAFTVVLPQFRLNVSRVTPFKSKISSSKLKWYENIGITYNFDAKMVLNTYDSLLSNYETWKKNSRYGMQHNLNIDAPFTILKYINVNPNLRYTERWYFQTLKKTWVYQDAYIKRADGSIVTLPNFTGFQRLDTLQKFKAARDFETSVSLSTKVIGIYNFKNKYIKALRHIVTPSISGIYRPDFGTSFWNYYDSVKTNALTNELTGYSYFDLVSSLYGMPQPGMVGAIRWSLNNNFDLKVFSKSDTIKHEKKIGILERLNFSGGYNFAAKQFKLENFLINGSFRFTDNLGANFTVNLDPYSVDSTNRRVPVYYWKMHHQLLRFSQANFSFNGSIRSKQKTNSNTTANENLKSDYVIFDPNVPYDFSIPWEIRASYNINLSKQVNTRTNQDTLVFTQTLSYGANFSITSKWRVDVSSGFDIQRKMPTYTVLNVTRDLHCWALSFNFVAYPLNLQQFLIELRPTSALLKDLKIPHRKTATNYPFN